MKPRLSSGASRLKHLMKFPPKTLQLLVQLITLFVWEIGFQFCKGISPWEKRARFFFYEEISVFYKLMSITHYLSLKTLLYAIFSCTSRLQASSPKPQGFLRFLFHSIIEENVTIFNFPWSLPQWRFSQPGAFLDNGLCSQQWVVNLSRKRSILKYSSYISTAVSCYFDPFNWHWIKGDFSNFEHFTSATYNRGFT